MRSFLAAAILMTTFLAGGCDQIGIINRTPSTSGLGPMGGNVGAGGASGQGGSAAVGLPCEVQTILVKYCASCHGAPPAGGAPRSLVTYADLTKPDLMTSSLTEAEVALQRIQNKASPMPPSPASIPTASEIATLQGWVSSGYPSGTCGVSVGAGGSPGGGGNAGAGGSGNPGSGGAGGGSSQAGSGGTGGGSGNGLPCNIQTFLVNNCASCHGSTPSSGAPRSLFTYADLTKPDPANTSMTEAQVALLRMQSTVSPMPPSPGLAATSAQIAMMQTWINSGYPTGTCGGGTGGAAGSGGSGGSGGSSQPGAGGASGGSSQGGSSGAGGSASSGLPCDVQTLLVSTCASCHGTTLAGGAPRSLVTYSDLTKPDPANTAMTEAQVALQRMQNTVSPMPPFPAAAATSAQIATLQNWINAGYPAGTCGGGGTGGTSGSGGSSGAGGSSKPGSGGTSGAGDAGVPNGTLPCAVQTMLVNRCDSCHGSTPAGGAPRSLMSYADLTKPDPANTAMTEAQVALARMQSTTAPMPPAPAAAATAAEIATLQTWINGGYPSGSCSGDAGPPPNDPLNTPATCTSKKTYGGGTDGGGSMYPGRACISCHGSSGGEAPRFVIAGTLYPTGHEPDSCNGVNGTNGAKIVVTGSNGTSITLTPNAAGNFYSSTALPPPYAAKVVDAAGVERVMVSTASTGDCNSCHTQTGANGAPGRITMPM
jgi:mono/diheme cytochrome c family protein